MTDCAYIDGRENRQVVTVSEALRDPNLLGRALGEASSWST